MTLDAPLEGPYFNDSTYSLAAAARGEGVAMARSSIVGEDLESGVLKRLFGVSAPSAESYWFRQPQGDRRFTEGESIPRMDQVGAQPGSRSPLVTGPGAA